MIDQLAIFTVQGQLLCKYNALGKKFSEQQFNKFIHTLIAQSIATSNSKFPTLSVDSHTFMFHETKQPFLYYVVSYSSSESLELNQEAEQVLNIAIKLWDSLGLNDAIRKNQDHAKSKKNRHNYTWLLEGAEDKLLQFEQFFTVKYESLKVTSNVSRPPNSLAEKQQQQQPKKKAAAKKNQSSVKSRKWGANGMIDDDAMAESSALDFSPASMSNTASDLAAVDTEGFGTRTKTGEFLIKQIDDLLVQSKNDQMENQQKKSQGRAFDFLQKHWLGNKTITESDLSLILDKLKKQLIAKNVTPTVADYLAAQVSQNLVGSKTANWTSVENTARESLGTSLTNLLTPSVSVDLLHEIQRKAEDRDKDGNKNPYVFSIVGVNGVGKSTNLSKLAFWLLQNHLKVLIVACDTFRSGAVEQLRVHVENLAQLIDEDHVRGSKNERGKTGNDFIELFEAGYGGSDLVTKTAKKAIKYAREQAFDVVLMDTAGRRHNDATLMSPLKSFAEQAKPDKIIMVGEALVGTDSVQQARSFNQVFGKGTTLDFFIISKCDTVGDMLGTMVNMVYATGIPILFVGVGQTYTDLRTLSVPWAVETLLS
ncbi:Signal recognition particle receptor subunit alpha Ecym_3179 [Eremothecium cymbalariae DBVPG|uniref:Signal recognition particle receptor subunit alpha homolog n=1 Tax=Eremothecium cymbalariae (strain CBS 270.75 / DBVPG 7215 / KCTC 17166 / NRRL Y-17582) TaxID=931890 RepID=G8JRB0_ERECY|nr:Hypothetical protein Ecym_3179 [Eremothecium cymbalariae DBVPG\